MTSYAYQKNKSWNETYVWHDLGSVFRKKEDILPYYQKLWPHRHIFVIKDTETTYTIVMGKLSDIGAPTLVFRRTKLI